MKAHLQLENHVYYMYTLCCVCETGVSGSSKQNADQKELIVNII